MTIENPHSYHACKGLYITITVITMTTLKVVVVMPGKGLPGTILFQVSTFLGGSNALLLRLKPPF